MTTKEAVEQLVKALKEDTDYYYTWQANIAMAFYDVHSTDKPDVEFICMDKHTLHASANTAAKNFLDQLTCKYCELAEEVEL